MKQPLFPLSTFAAMTLSIAGSASADIVHNDEVIIARNLLCVGDSCVDGENDIPGRDGIKIKDANTTILFEDTSGSSNPNHDWQLNANDGVGGDNLFSLQDITAGTTPLTIMGDAPDNALFMAEGGHIGLGTALPVADLHLKNGALSDIIFEAPNGTDFRYSLRADTNGIGLFDGAPGASQPFIPRFSIAKSAPAGALQLFNGSTSFNSQFNDYDFQVQGTTRTLIFGDAGTGNVGIGTDTPDAPFEVSSDATFNFFRLTAETAPINQSVDIVYTKGPDDRGQLRYNIVEAGDSPQVAEMTLDADGDMVLTGTLTTMGPTCAAGCDRVFDDGYALPSIEDHAGEMFGLGHLPAIGATVPHAPVNLSERQGNIINALEYAHIYIAQQQEQISDQQIIVAQQQQVIAQQQQQMAQVLARLAVLEAE